MTSKIIDKFTTDDDIDERNDERNDNGEDPVALVLYLSLRQTVHSCE